MVRKWEAMYYLQKLGGLSLVALIIAAPSLASANTVVTSQTYVDMQDNLKVDKNQGTGTNNENVGKALVVNSSGVLELQTVSVDISGKQPVSTGTSVGVTGGTWKNLGDGTYTTVNDSGQNVVIDVNATADGTLADADSGEADFAKVPTAGAVKTYVDSQSVSAANGILTQTITDGDTTHAPSGDAVNDALVNKQTKPASGVASGKVLTYTGSDANANVSASYVTVPVATGAPSTNTPTAFAEVWIQ